MTYELPRYRPPSEAYSLLVKVMRGCPWNRCTFCSMYKDMRFEGKNSIRLVEDVKRDIDTLRAVADATEEISKKLGYNGEVNEYVLGSMLETGLDVYNFPWLAEYGHKPERAFLADSNPLVVKTDDLVEILTHLYNTFPSLKRVTSYARAKTVVMKKSGELERLKEAGLTRLHLGLESGDDVVLERVEKGATSYEMIEGGKRARELFELSEYVMPGLGGRELSDQHARGTARVLNAINPHYTRLRPLGVSFGTPLYDAYQSGEFEVLSPHEILRELRTMIGELDITGRVCFDHNMNPCYREPDGIDVGEGRVSHVFSLDYEGYKFPEGQGNVLALIDHALKIDERRYVDAHMRL